MHEVIRRQDIPEDVLREWSPTHKAIADIILAGPGAWMKFYPPKPKHSNPKIHRLQQDLHNNATRRGIRIETFYKRGVIYVNYIAPLHPLLVEKSLRLIARRKGAGGGPVSQETEVRGN